MMKNYFLLKIFWAVLTVCFCTQWVSAQTKTVSGKVSSAEDGTSIPGVNILVKGTSTGSATDVDGRYSIQVGEEDVLVFSSIGYATQEIPVAGRTTIDVELTPDVQSLEEVVVVGYGSQLKKEVTGSVQTVAAK